MKPSLYACMCPKNHIGEIAKTKGMMIRAMGPTKNHYELDKKTQLDNKCSRPPFNPKRGEVLGTNKHLDIRNVNIIRFHK